MSQLTQSAVSLVVEEPQARGMRSVWNSANKGITCELHRRNVAYAAKRIAVYIDRKTAIKREISISVARHTVGGVASRGYVRWRN